MRERKNYHRQPEKYFVEEPSTKTNYTFYRVFCNDFVKMNPPPEHSIFYYIVHRNMRYVYQKTYHLAYNLAFKNKVIRDYHIFNDECYHYETFHLQKTTENLLKLLSENGFSSHIQSLRNKISFWESIRNKNDLARLAHKEMVNAINSQ